MSYSVMKQSCNLGRWTNKFNAGETTRHSQSECVVNEVNSLRPFMFAEHTATGDTYLDVLENILEKQLIFYGILHTVVFRQNVALAILPLMFCIILIKNFLANGLAVPRKKCGHHALLTWSLYTFLPGTVYSLRSTRCRSAVLNI